LEQEPWNSEAADNEKGIAVSDSQARSAERIHSVVVIVGDRTFRNQFFWERRADYKSRRVEVRIRPESVNNAVGNSLKAAGRWDWGTRARPTTPPAMVCAHDQWILRAKSSEGT
jgi:hypothetical protein